MMKVHKPKGLTQVKAFVISTLLGMRRYGVGTRCMALTGMLSGGLALLGPNPAAADTAYRCGNEYSPHVQCANGPATPTQTITELRITGQDKANPNSDFREAQALEKQRLQAERQAAQTAAVLVSTPSSPPTSVTQSDLLPQNGKRKRKHGIKKPSPFFTAVDPSALPKKKSTSKAVHGKP
jgi:hypothetical protein